MHFIIGLLTVVLVLNCLLLVLLVLVQLPKKEAGVGMAFGGSATDALFGAGSGNVLTKVTKYSAIAFFVLTLLVAFLQSGTRDTSGKALEAALAKQPAPAAPAPAGSSPGVVPVATNILTTTAASLSNAPAAATNPPGQ